VTGPAALDAAEAPAREALRQLCEEWGYGRMMQLASQMWATKDPLGALTVGPARALLPRDRAVAALLLSHPAEVIAAAIAAERERCIRAICGLCRRGNDRRADRPDLPGYHHFYNGEWMHCAANDLLAGLADDGAQADHTTQRHDGGTDG